MHAISLSNVSFSRLITRVLFSLTLAFFGTQSAAQTTALTEQDWDLAKQDGELTIYTKAVEGSPYKTFKAHIAIQQTPERIVKAIRDVAQFTQWMADTTYSEVIEQSDSWQTAYVINKTPWPVKDRDGIFHYEITRASPEAYTIHISTLSEGKALNPEYVRVASAKGFWQIEKHNNGSMVTYQLQLDPGGSIPAWLANTTVVNAPEYTLKKLKQKVESE